MAEFLMPSLGADMDAGTVTQWLVRPGDEVRRGDVIVVVDTEKADIEVEIFEDGVVEELLVPEGAKVPVGTPLARLSSSRPTPSRAAAAEPAVEPKRTPRLKRSVAEATPARQEAGPLARKRGGGGRTVPGPEPRLRVSPRARRIAEERGVDPASVAGSGPDAAIVGADVEAGSPGVPSATRWLAADVDRSRETRPPGRQRLDDRSAAMRAAIARLMARSKREIPHYYLATTIDFSHARSWLGDRNAARPVEERLLPAALLLKATALGVRAVPDLNGSWVDDAFVPSEKIHVGVAISLRGGGLVAPAIHDTDERDLDDLMRGLRDLVTRARAGTLRASEMSDPTITVTNLGDQGVDAVYGVIYPPQVALVGFGAITERPWAVDGMVGAHPVVTATLAADHRASDGALGARLLNVIDRLLQEPDQW